MAAISVNQGTQTVIQTTLVGGTETPVVRLDTGSGTTAAEFGGTITRVTELLRGTVTNLATGTINALAAGTITAGTVETLNIGRRHADEFATVVTSGTSTLGTIRAAVTGSAIYVTGLVVSVQAASNVEIGNGGTANLIGGSWFFAGSAGLALTPIDPPLRTSSGSALVYKQSANTGMSITTVGYID